MTRRTAAAAVLLACFALTGCSDEPAPDWTGAEVVAFGMVDGSPHLLFWKPGSAAPTVGPSASQLSIDDPAWTRIRRDGDRSVLAWTDGSGPTHFAVLDTTRGSIDTLPYTANTGVFAVGGDKIAYSEPTLDGTSAVVVRDLTSGDVAQEATVPFTPAQIEFSEGGFWVVGANDGMASTALVDRDGGDLTASVIGPAATVGDASLPRSDGSLAVVTAPVATAESGVIDAPTGLWIVTDGQSELTAEGTSPGLVEQIGPDRIAVVEDEGGSQTIRFVTIGAGSVTVTLASAAPVLGLVHDASGLWVLQIDSMTLLADDGTALDRSQMTGEATTEWQ